MLDFVECGCWLVGGTVVDGWWYFVSSCNFCDKFLLASAKEECGAATTDLGIMG